jgi:23S rRNA (cytidine1920-2'-O)/16S rRNA (cytidine1409-2'-O)-methyltransferase
VRLDKYLVAQGYFESRNRALAAIKAGEVTIDGKQAKASQKVLETSEVTINSGKFYVSRAAKKLEQFLEQYPMAWCDAWALDIGSSTGGFAQIVLEHAVESLDCVDVGSDQLHHSLRTDPRLSLHEQTDIRAFESATKFTLITCDVSFISILQILNDIDRLAAEDADIIILYKPQFEVGREVRRDSRGVVQNTQEILKCQETFITKTQALGWKLQHHAASQLAGKEGNQEYVYAFKSASTKPTKKNI